MHKEQSIFPESFYNELKSELYAIKDYRTTHRVAYKYGGFVGQRDHMVILRFRFR
jgi:hypothetical protein